MILSLTWAQSAKHSKGFTLIEAVLYIALTAILLVVMTNLGFYSFVARQKALSEEEILENANFALNKISVNIKKAREVLLPIENGTELSLEMDDPLVNPTRFYKEGNSLMMAQGSSGGVELITNSVNVSSLNFTKMVNNDNGVSIKINLELSSAVQNVSSAFETAVSLYQ